MGLQTVFDFTLPKGYIDADGVLHRHGAMRLSTARDEIEPLRDPRVSGPDDPYLTILVIARVISELGTLSRITPSDVEGLFAADLAFLQDLYGIINFGDPADVPALQRAVLPAEEVDDGYSDDGVDARGSDDAAGDVPAPATDEFDDAADASERDGGDASAAGPLAPRRHGRIEEVVSGTGR